MMRAAVLGSPIAHSLSPVLHRAAYAHLGLADWKYDAIECGSDGLPALIQRVRGDASFGGYSLTMPLKVVVLPLLDELEQLAADVAAVNTVVPRDGGLYGANTDVPGMVNALAEAGLATAERPVILGAGGSAQAAVAALARMGTTVVRAVVRSPARAAGLQEVAGRFGVTVAVEPWDGARAGDADLVISAVPSGAFGALESWRRDWPAGCALFDLVYAPWPTPLATAAS
jgi:shikimate dehydrogenase